MGVMKLLRTLGSLRRNLPRVIPLMRDRRVSLGLKLCTVAAALFVVSPADLLGDIPVVGMVDDAVLLALLANLFVGVASRQISSA
jgi:uncharacterized membrane protein YkvA (DUF1232 family)